MSNRLGLTATADLTPEQRPLYDHYVQLAQKRYKTPLRLALDDGTPIGPYGVLLHHPKVGYHFTKLVRAVQEIPGLSFYGREVVIAVSGSRSRAAFENYAHMILGQEAGLSRSELHDIHAGTCPASLTDEGKVAFDIATALAEGQTMDDAFWDRAVDILGRDGAAAAVHYTAFYSMVGVMLNGFNAKAPDVQG